MGPPRVPFPLARLRAAGAAVCLLALALLAGGCAMTAAHRSSRIQRLEETSPTNIVALLGSNSVELRIRVPGRDVRARAAWSNAPAAGADISFDAARLHLDQSPLVPRREARTGERVPVRGESEWRRLAVALVERVVPPAPGAGVLLAVQDQELVAYRNPTGAVVVVPLAHRPADVRIDRRIGNAEFAQETLQLLTGDRRDLMPASRRVLYVTGEDPAFVLLDLRQQRVVFLANPVDEASSSGTSSPEFAWRTLDWFILRSLVLTAVKNPVTLVSRGLWHMGHSGAAMLSGGLPTPAGPPPPLYEGPGMDLEAWERELDRLVSSKCFRGDLSLYIDGDAFFPALIDAFQRAKRSIDMLVYIFDNDDYAVKIADLLRERSAAVRVRVLFDEMGTLFASISPPDSPSPPGFEAPASIARYLRHDSHVHVRQAANPWLTANHTKLIVVDQRTAFLGGMNIGREYRYDWHDLMVGVTGPIVGRFLKDFHLAWEHAGPFGDFGVAYVQLFDRVNSPAQPAGGGIRLRPLYTSTGRMEIARAQLEAIRRARRYIYVENAYLLDDRIVRELAAARRRGVDVRVILPGRNDLGVMRTSNQVTANALLANGVRVYAYPGMTHVKAAIYDGWACLGSANFNKMSLRVAQEINLAYSNPDAVGRLRRELFEADFARSRELTEPMPVTWLDSVVETLAEQF